MYTRIKIGVIFFVRSLKSGGNLKLGVLCSAVSSSSTGQINTVNKEKTVSLKPFCLIFYRYSLNTLEFKPFHGAVSCSCCRGLLLCYLNADQAEKL